MILRTSFRTASLATAVLALSACDGNLTVVDDLVREGANQGVDPPSDNSPGVMPPPSQTTDVEGPCGCATSPGLMPLICNGQEVLLLDNDVVQVASDGSAAAFNLGTVSSEYQLAYWDGTHTRILPSNGMLLGLNAAGDRLLVSGLTGLEVWNPGDDAPFYYLQLDNGVERGALSAAGDVVTGLVYEDYEETQTFLVQTNLTTGQNRKVASLGSVSLGWAYVNPDASAAVGVTSVFDRSATDPTLLDTSLHAFQWNRQGLSTSFAGVDPANEIWPEALSADGSVIAGRSATSHQHFVWSAAGGYQELAEASWRSATFISADGSVVLGSLNPGELPVIDSAAFRWTQETGTVNLTPGLPSLALGMSDDGNTAVAYSWDDEQFVGAPPRSTYVWDVQHGTRKLTELLEARGVDATGWEFGTPRKLSADGKVLFGRAMCGKVPTLYRVVLSD